ncbi:MAG: choice-of-anchor Q domain-containing protein [Kiritimatiellia bacterium]
MSILNNCLVISNKTGNAVYSCTLYNCLVISNTAVYAVRGSKLYNCTVANNSGYGLYYKNTSATNCIVYFNKLGNYVVLTDPMAYCCTTPPQTNWATGDGNITNEPSFVNTAAGDFQLNRNSPCINAGTNGVWTATGFDLAGNPRIDKASGLVDIGCYEYQLPYRGTILLLQ